MCVSDRVNRFYGFICLAYALRAISARDCGVILLLLLNTCLPTSTNDCNHNQSASSFFSPVLLPKRMTMMAAAAMSGLTWLAQLLASFPAINLRQSI